MNDREILTEQKLRNIYYDASEGYQSAEKLYPKSKRERFKREQKSRKKLVKNSRHLHEI